MGGSVVSELELDRAFVGALVSSREFCEWVLRQTKFGALATRAVLLDNEQAAAKPRKKPENWWRHWWCRLPDGSESETDIFAVFGFEDAPTRIALHIEDKPPHGRFTPNQYLNYRCRAEFMAAKSEYMNYSDFTTILLAPKLFCEEHEEKARHFDRIIAYESVAQFIPLFSRSIVEAEAAKKNNRRALRRGGKIPAVADFH